MHDPEVAQFVWGFIVVVAVLFVLGYMAKHSMFYNPFKHIRTSNVLKGDLVFYEGVYLKVLNVIIVDQRTRNQFRVPEFGRIKDIRYLHVEGINMLMPLCCHTGGYGMDCEGTDVDIYYFVDRKNRNSLGEDSLIVTAIIPDAIKRVPKGRHPLADAGIPGISAYYSHHG
jgi:hypothetical protein